MYRDFYRLSDEPFRVTPDPDFLFLADQYKEALAAIVYGIARRKGFVCITGEVGVGKTTILRSYLNGAEDQRLTFVYIFNPKVSFPVLMRTILRDLGQPTEGDVPDMVERLHEHLITCYRADKTVVLFVDEAQNMPQETLENLRMLSNLETATDKLIQIVLVGQPELDELLSRPQLRQLKSRIVVHARLGPLNRKDSLAYIRHRLSRVALDERPIFTDSAMELIYREAEGVPRIINILCDAALITGFGYRLRPVPPKVVREVIRDTFGRRPRKNVPWALATTAAIALVSLGAGGFFLFHQQTPHAAVDSIGELIAATEKQNPAVKENAAHPPPAPPPASKPPEPPKQSSLPTYGPADEGPDPASDLVRVVSPLPKPSPPPPSAPPTAPSPSAAASPATNNPRPEPAPPPPPNQAQSPPAAAPARVETPAAPAPAAPPTPRIVATVPPPKPSEPPNTAPSRSVTVKQGDTLSKLSFDIYGTADSLILGRLQQANPGLTNINRLYIGQVIAFPTLTPEQSTDQRSGR